MRSGLSKLRVALVLLSAAMPASAVELGISEGTNLAIAATPDGRFLIHDLYGRLWRLPVAGGMSTPLTGPQLRLRRPDVSPDGRRIVADGGRHGEQRLWLLEGDGPPVALGPGDGRDAYARWYPGGDRLVFASDRAGSWDLYETWLADGTTRRLTSGSGDELEPAVSADGRLLAWIEHGDERWELWTAEIGLPPRLLHGSPHRLAAPSIRPDNSVVVFVEQAPAGASLMAAILSDPPVAKPLAAGEDYFPRPAVWLDRQRLLYTADGRIRLRLFGELGRTEVPFTAWISPLGPPGTEFGLEGDSPALHHGRYVLRTGRLLDVEVPAYRDAVDILIEDDAIAAISEPRDWPDTPVLPYPDLVAMPGFIQLGLDADAGEEDGARLLACGVTTVVSLPEAGAGDRAVAPPWQGGSAPGPQIITGAASRGGIRDIRGVADPGERVRRIRAAREGGAIVVTDTLYPDLEAGASLLAADASLPTSPAGRQYEDVSALLQASGARLMSGGVPAGPHGGGASLADPRSCRLQRQLRRLLEAGTPPGQAIRRFTADAARLLGIDGGRGVLRPGTRADLLLLAGDPLTDGAAEQRIEAVVTGGRFFTPAGLTADSSENLTKNEDSAEMSPIGDRFDIRLPMGPWRR